MMLQLLVALVAVGAALSSVYIPLKLPAPFDDISVVQYPHVGRVAPLKGPVEINSLLEHSRKLFKDEIVSPETVVFDTEGLMYMFTEKGIYRTSPRGDSYGNLELFLEVPGGRPLSGAFDSQGILYFCDIVKGLGRVDIDSRELKYVLSGSDVPYCNDLAISSKDEIFIANIASIRVPSPELGISTGYAAVVSGIADGRLTKYTPSTGGLETLIPDLGYGSGVELAHDESYVLASDAGPGFRTLRYWLSGPKAGTHDIFIDSLPGHGDGISRGSNRTYWITIYATTGLLQSALLHFRLLRWAASRFPQDIQDRVVPRHGLVIQVNAEGEFLRSFHDSGGVYGRTGSCVEREGRLYVGGYFPFVRVLNLNETAT